MIASCNIISCNFSSLPLKPHSLIRKSSFSSPKSSSILFVKSNYSKCFSKITTFFYEKLQKKGHLHICQNSFDTQIPPDPSLLSEEEEEEEENELLVDGSGDSENGSNGGGEERDWTTSFLLFAFWAGLIYYVFFLAPDQTPVTDLYFLKKLLNLKGDDGFKMNEVLVGLWYIMGLWPLVYSMLLLPTARSSKSKIPLWPFLALSFFGGAYALIPYFVLWRPPAPAVEECELRRWPLNFLESKLTAGIHITTIDFTLLSAFAPFWVYNDMTARKWDDKGSWLLPLSLVPFLGPALYLLLRPSLSETPIMISDDK